MINLSLNYTRPWLLLILIPAALATLIPHFKVVKKYRRTRNRIISLVLHMLAMVISVNLLAGLTFKYEISNLNNEVILLVDTSESNADLRAEKDDFVKQILNVADREYKVGIVKFGYDQKYVSQLSSDMENVYKQYLESEDPDPTATNLAAALEYAKGLFNNPQTAKIVIISDGIETDGAATSVIKEIVAKGIKVDVAPFNGELDDEIQIVAVNTPDTHVIPGESFLIEAVLKSNLGTAQSTVMMKIFDNGVEIKAEEVTARNEETNVSVEIMLEEKGIHELRVEIEGSKDTSVKNNAYYSYINLKVFDKILLIERYENESSKLQELLAGNYQLTALSIESDLEQIPRDIQTLAEYEQVILVNIAYADMPAGFEEMLNQYVYDLGGGLFTVGGKNDIINDTTVPHAYNRQDMESSKYYKQMLPVNAVNYTPPIAVMIVVDCSDSMNVDGKIDAAINGAISCLDALSDRDFCGVMSFQSTASERQQVLPVSQRETIIETIRSLNQDPDAINNGTIFSDAILKAGSALSVIDNVEKKHIIMVTDGEPSDTFEDYAPYIEGNVRSGITMSIVTIDIKGNYRQNMEDTAAEGGGKFYNVTKHEINTLPTVMRDDIALEAVSEIEYGKEFVPTIDQVTPVVSGISQDMMPPLTGYYGTVIKEGATVVLKGDYVPIYAQWKYGKGNVGSFLSALNEEWSSAFMNDETGKTIVKNIVDNIFPMEEVRADAIEYVLKTDNYTTQLNVYASHPESLVEIEVRPVSAELVNQIGSTVPVNAAESNRRFTFEIRNPGLYEIKIRELDEQAQPVSEIVLYQTFSYSEEYNAFPQKKPIGKDLLLLLASDGDGNEVLDPVDVFMNFRKTLDREYDPRILFLILAIVCVLLDIAVRKFKFKWPHELIRERKQRKAENAENNR